MHLAIALAKKTKNTGAPVNDADHRAVELAAAAEFAQLETACAGDKFALAARIYGPLDKKSASKAEAAQYFGELLLEAKQRRELDAASARERLL